MINWLNIPVSTTQIYEEAFFNTEIEAVKVPDNCTSIGRRAFASCRKLKKIIIPPCVVAISDDFLDDSEKAVVYCYEASEAYNWCVSHNKPFVLLNP